MKYKKVMTFGTFDIFHQGHIDFLLQARNIAQELFTVIATDKNVKKIKKNFPLHNQNVRKKIVEAQKIADRVEIWDEKNPMKRIEFFQPDAVFLWYDQLGFSDILQKKFPHIYILRGKPFYPEKYKSSLLREKNI